MIGSWVKTTILMAGVIALFGAIGMVLGGASGMLLALLLGGAINLWGYWFSDQMVLKMYNAREVDEFSAPALYAIVRELARNAAIPMPKVYLIDEAQPNAFATGRNPEHAAVAATSGILQLLSAKELRGVMAHELAHIKHRDILISTISAMIAGAISSLAQFGMIFGSNDRERNVSPAVAILVMLLAPIAAMLIQFAISRTREFEADREGAKISGDPSSLASALSRIESYAKGIPFAAAERHPETAQMMIINPLTADGMQKLFSTHPSTRERIERLLSMTRF